MLQASDHDAFHWARTAAHAEGMLVGVSSGGSIWAIRELLARSDQPARIVTVFPDGAARYLTKMFNEEWLGERGLL
jgi:cystathionine beta-synthase